MSPRMLHRLALLLAAAAALCAIMACMATASRANTPTPHTVSASYDAGWLYWETNRGLVLDQCSGDAPVFVMKRLPRNVLGQTYLGGCVIEMNRRFNWRGYGGSLRWCATALHEWGHDLGIPHNRSNRGLMAAVDDGYVPPACFRYVVR